MLEYKSGEFGETHYEYKDDKRSVSFSPLLSIQRHVIVQDVIEDFYGGLDSRVNCVAEFGTASFTFLRYRLLECDFLDTVHQIDLDEQVINSGLFQISNKLYRRNEYRKGRKKPLTVNIFRGNVAQKDDRVSNADIVVGIELIEHLEPEDFKKFPENIFGFIRPKLVIFTTPNYDYNVLFENGGAFRNTDHKFEFTRQQFQDWADGIVERYPDYRVRIFGIGEPPKGCQLDVGFCSQMAIFELAEFPKEQQVTTQSCNDYTLVGSYNYFIFCPFYNKRDEIIDRVLTLSSSYKTDEDYVKKFLCQECCAQQLSCLPLQLFCDIIESCPDVETLKSVLKMNPNKNFRIAIYDDVPYLIVSPECENHFDFE